MRSKLLAAVLACSAVFGLASCGAMLPESSSETETTTGTAAQRVIETTKTATMGDDYDEDDEDYEGYTTTTSVTAGTLENPDVSIDEGYDPDIIATATKRHGGSCRLFTACARMSSCCRCAGKGSRRCSAHRRRQCAHGSYDARADSVRPLPKG